MIGVFDSGVGGLTVYKELLRALPGESFAYLGDTARVPYGIRSPETIRRYSLENCLFLIEKGATLIVVACNTATALALPFLKSVLKVPVIGVVAPGVTAALAATKNRRIGIIATEATIRSRAYEDGLRAVDSGVTCFSRATPLLVPIAEEGLLDDKILFPIFDHYLRTFRDDGIDTLILGCTHYPILKAQLERYFGGNIAMVDSARATALAVKDFLRGAPTLASSSASLADNPLYVTDAPERVGKIAGVILGQEAVRLEKVALV